MNDQQLPQQLDTTKILDQALVRPDAQAFNEYVGKRLAETGVSTMTTEQYEAFAAGWAAAIAYRGKADPRLADLAIDEGWIVEIDEGCTCGTGGLPAHMPGCGEIPVAPLEDVLDAHSIVNGADTTRNVITVYTVVSRSAGATSWIGAQTEQGAREVVRREEAKGAKVERIEAAIVTQYQTVERIEVAR